MRRSIDRYRDLPATRLALLAGLVVAGLALTCPSSRADTIEGADLREALVENRFVAYRGAQRAAAEFSRNGTVVLTGDSGRFEGAWRVSGGALCLVFGDEFVGPPICVRVADEGLSLRASNGTLLAEVPGAAPVDRPRP